MYYFDVEVDDFTTKNAITIQVASLDWNGKMGKLQIYKIWEFDDPIKMFDKFFADYQFFDEWNFIPVGFNLRFDFSVARRYAYKLGYNQNPWVWWNRPHLDLKHIIVLENQGFKGSSLANFSPKVGNGGDVGEWYKQGEYDKIIWYITQEAKAFQKVFSHYLNVLKRNPNPWRGV